MGSYSDRFEQAVDGLDVEVDGGVVRIRDTRGAWLCGQKGWCEARAQLRQQRPTTDPERARQELRMAVSGPVLTAGSGADRGSREARQELAALALDAGLLPPTLASLVPVRAVLAINEDYDPAAWWDAARGETRAGAVQGALRDWVLGETMAPLAVPLEEAVAAMRGWSTLPAWEDGPRGACTPILWDGPVVVDVGAAQVVDGWPTEALVLAARKAVDGAVMARRFSEEGVTRWTLVEPRAAEALAGMGQDVRLVRVAEGGRVDG